MLVDAFLGFRPPPSEPQRTRHGAGSHEDVVAWWAYRAQVMFTLDREIAETLLAAVLDVPADA